MPGKKDKKGKSLTKKDTDLWKAMTKDVRRLPGRGYEEGDGNEPSAKSLPSKERAVTAPAETPRKKAGVKGKDVDGATTRKFTRGKMEIEATLDLHGMNQAEARESLKRFITASHQRGRRCVLVITGKGVLGRPAILKARIPEWLEEGALATLVLKTARAQTKDGGEGALYVLLRRERS